MTIVLRIKPLGSGRFAGFVCGYPVVRSSRTPFFDAARALIARGTSADARMVMVHPNGTTSLKSTLGEAARLCVREGQKEIPRFDLWQRNPMAALGEGKEWNERSMSLGHGQMEVDRDNGDDGDRSGPVGD